MNPVVEKREEKRNEEDSDEFDSNVYNSADSFIADEEESEVDISQDDDFNPVRRPQPLKKKYLGLTKEEVQMANQNIKKTRGRRLKKMKEKSQNAPDDFVEYAEEESPEDEDRMGRTGGGGLEKHQDLLRNIFNDDMFADEDDKNGQGKEKGKGNEDFSKMLPPEEQQKYFLTDLDQKIKKKDIPERLQIRFSGRPEIVPEEMVHEARWIVRKLIQRNRLSEKLEAFLEVKVYGVLENLLWKNQEVMYIWMYSRHDITSNTHSQNRIEHSYELTLDDLWFIYFADEEWQRCSEMRISLTKLMKLLEQHSQLSGLAKMAFDNAMDFDHLTACYEFLKFRLKCFIDEDQIEKLLEDQPKSGGGESPTNFRWAHPAHEKAQPAQGNASVRNGKSGLPNFTDSRATGGELRKWTPGAHAHFAQATAERAERRSIARRRGILVAARGHAHRHLQNAGGQVLFPSDHPDASEENLRGEAVYCHKADGEGAEDTDCLPLLLPHQAHHRQAHVECGPAPVDVGCRGRGEGADQCPVRNGLRPRPAVVILDAQNQATSFG